MSRRLNNVDSRQSSDTLTDSQNREVIKLIGEFSFTEILNYFSGVNYQHSLLNYLFTPNGLRSLRRMKSTRNTPSAYLATGIRPPKAKNTGTKESSTSKSYVGGQSKSAMDNHQKRQEIRKLSEQYRQRKLSSTTGKLEPYTPSTKIREPFTVSQHSPNTLLCSACERSTYTLILENSGSKPSIVTRCTTCGSRGKIALTSSSLLSKMLTS